MTSKAARSSFYVPGGTLKLDAASYVMRDADLDLHAAIARGELCYVLTSRQMGKSSLMVRMAARLREERAQAIVIDLNALGQNLTAEQWYLGLLGLIGSQLDLENELEGYWQAHSTLGPLERWLGALRDVVLERVAEPIVMFIDEIDATRSLPFSSDEFFAAIRELYNERSDVPELQRLTFCLLGVATPSDLIQDTRITPFNVGHRIELTDFTEQEAQVLLPGLHHARSLAPALLSRILYWTGGHPCLTQRLCQAVVEDRIAGDPNGVDRLCADIFLSPQARERDDNLLFVRDRMLRGGADPVQLLTIYSNIRTGKLVEDDPAHPLLSQLRLAGVVRSENGFLKVRNRIYERVFDQKFVENNQPLDEVERQRKAEQRGRTKVLSWAVPAVVLFASLAFLAWWQSHRAQQISASWRSIADAGLITTSNVADEIHAASANRPELLGMYAKIVHVTGPFVETMLKIEPRDVAANDLKANSLYVAADDAIRRGDTAAAASNSRESLARAEKLKADADIRLRAIAARLYATAAEMFSKMSATKETQADIQKAENLARDVSARMKPDDSFTLGSLSTTYNMLGAAEEGMDHWDRAVQFYQRNAGARQKVSDLYIQKGGDDGIFEVVHAALEERNRIARIEFENHRYDASRKILEERSLAIANTLVAWNGQPARHRTEAQRHQARLDLWDVEDKLAFVLAARKTTWPEALQSYTQAVGTGEKLVQADPSVPNQQKLEGQVAAVARLQKLLGMTEDAQHAYFRYVALVHERVNKQPNAESYAKLGDALQQLASFEAHHGTKSAAPADYQNSLDFLSKVSSKDGSVEREIGAVNLKLADVQSGFGQTDQAKPHYRDAVRASQRCIEFDRRNVAGGDTSAQAILMSDYQNLAFGSLGLGDRKSAQEALAKMLDAAQAAGNQAQASLAQNKTPQSISGAAFAYGILGWAELLNNHPQESIRASEAALALDGQQAWIHANRAHAYLLADRADQAKAIYLAHRGEEMYDEPFELSVLDDFAQLRKLGFDRPAMAEIEQLLGKVRR
jgi:hypothetical protein